MRFLIEKIKSFFIELKLFADMQKALEKDILDKQ